MKIVRIMTQLLDIDNFLFLFFTNFMKYLQISNILGPYGDKYSNQTWVKDWYQIMPSHF